MYFEDALQDAVICARKVDVSYEEFVRKAKEVWDEQLQDESEDKEGEG